MPPPRTSPLRQPAHQLATAAPTATRGCEFVAASIDFLAPVLGGAVRVG
jgi:hypothetical protein